MSLEMAHKVILPPKKNYIPQFLKQRDINSYYACFSFTLAFLSVKYSVEFNYPEKLTHDKDYQWH
jgi:hypothetical protein